MRSRVHTSSTSAPSPIRCPSRPRGFAVWRPELAAGQLRRAEAIGLELLDVSLAGAADAGARPLVMGFPNLGGVMDAATVADVLAALAAGLHVASGLHQRLGDTGSQKRSHGKHFSYQNVDS